MIDTHAHLDFPQFDPDRELVIESGFERGLEAVINVGTDLESSRKSLELAKRHANIYAAVGVHPHHAKDCPQDYIRQLRQLTEGNAGSPGKVVAIGEIGLDYYRDMSPRDIQRKAFREQLDLARELGLPAVVHIRESMQDALRILSDGSVGEESSVRRGVLHSFPGDIAEAKAAMEMGFFISFAGPITYPRSTRVEVASASPLGRILVETDAPYLTPQVFRGKRNKPEYVRYVIEKLASIFSPYTFPDLERITSLNARRLFNLPLDRAPKYVYRIRRSLYINLTNRCTCNCYSCPRNGPGAGYVAGHYLFLKSEPSAAEILAAIEKEKDFNEIVFCGLGEPTLRLNELLQIASELKRQGHVLRLNTNGHGSLVNRIDLPAKLPGLFDRVSVSLNAQDAGTYVKICSPDRGEEAYEAVRKFIAGCIANGIPTEATVVDLPEVDVAACRQIATKLGASFRLRRYVPGES